jgi:hypothetical protein
VTFCVTRPSGRPTIIFVRRLISLFVPIVGWLLALSPESAGAASSPAPVEVTSTKFMKVRAPNGASGTWWEATLVLTARPMAGSPAQMVSRVRVVLTLAFELPALAGGERRLDFYRAEAECVALEPGRAEVRFFLPAELVKRDQLPSEPKYFGVELAVEGRPVPAGRAAYSAGLASPEARKSFQQRAQAAAAANEGLLLPQFLTPFANEYPRSTPSFVRKGAR